MLPQSHSSPSVLRVVGAVSVLMVVCVTSVLRVVGAVSVVPNKTKGIILNNEKLAIAVSESSKVSELSLHVSNVSG